MVDRYVAANLRRLPIFKTYTDADLDRLSSFCVTRRYEPNEAVFVQDEVARGMYLIVSGRLVLVQRRPDGSQVQLGIISANQFLNDAALTLEKRETASFIAVEPSIVILIPREGYQQFLSGAMLPLRGPAPLIPPVDNRPAAPGIPAHQPAPAPPMSNLHAGGRPTPLPTDRLTVPSQPQSPIPPKPQEASTVGSGNAIRNGVDVKERRFEGQRRDEQVVYMTRRHWWAVFIHVWKPAALFVVMTVGGVLLETPILRLIVFALGFLVPGAMMVYYVLEWRNDWLIVTNERLVHIRREILSWSTVITDIPLGSVQGVNAETNGLLANILDFGNIEIQLPGQVSNLNETIVPAPEDFKNYVFQQRSKAVQMAERKRHDALIDRELDKMFNAPLAGVGQPAPAVTPPAPVAPTKPPLFAMRYRTSDGHTVYRKHTIVWWRGMIMPIVLIIAGIVIAFGGALLPEGFSGLSGLFGLMLIALALGWAYLTDWLWRNDYVILSNHDLTVIKNRPLLFDSFEDHILLDRIDNSIAETGGLIRSLLRYGDVRVNLIGDDKPKVFARMPYPRAMREEISERQSRARKNAAEVAELRSVQGALEAVQAYHSRLTQHGVAVNPQQTPYVPPPAQNQPPFGGGRV